MNARDKILKQVRSSLNKKTPTNSVPTIEITPPPSNVIDPKERCQCFIDCAKESGCTTEAISNIQDLPQTVANYLAKHQLPMALCGWLDFSVLDWKTASIDFAPRVAQDGDQVGLTGVMFAIADTGTIVVQNSLEHPLSCSLLPEHHIAVIKPSQIYDSLVEATFNQPLLNELSSQTVLISGPSRTADIEQTLVIGAHGPKNVHLILLQELDD